MTRGRAIALLVITTIIWGATFPVVKGALADAGVWTFLAVRFGLAAVLLASTALRAGWPRSPWVAGCGVALLAGYAFQTWGLVTTTPARSAFITALSVILVPLVEPLVGMARLTWRVVTGAALALAGLAVLLRPEIGAASLGDVLTFGCALAFAAHTLLVQRAVRDVDASAVNAWQVVIVAALALPFGLTDTAPLHVSWRLGGAVVVTAVLATVAAFWALAAAQQVLSAGETAVMLACEPLAAAVISVLLGSDALTSALVAGGCLVIAGAVLATTNPAPPRLVVDLH